MRAVFTQSWSQVSSQQVGSAVQTSSQQSLSMQPGPLWTSWQLPAPWPQVVQSLLTARGVSSPTTGSNGPICQSQLGEQR